MLSFFLYYLGENKSVYSNKILPSNIKSINPIQKYPHIIESYICYNTFVSYGVFNVQHQRVHIDSYSSKFIIYAPSFF